MRLPRNARIFRGQLDAAPFIGVFFILLMFILLHTSLVSHPGVEITLPRSDELPGPKGPVLVVAIDGDGEIYFESRAVRGPELEERLTDRASQLDQAATLVVQADRTVPQKTLIQIAETARRAGIHKAVLATRASSLAARPTKEQEPQQ